MFVNVFACFRSGNSACTVSKRKKKVLKSFLCWSGVHSFVRFECSISSLLSHIVKHLTKVTLLTQVNVHWRAQETQTVNKVVFVTVPSLLAWLICERVFLQNKFHAQCNPSMASWLTIHRGVLDLELIFLQTRATGGAGVNKANVIEVTSLIPLKVCW